MRILIVTQYFPPEMGAPQARLSELAARLQSKGHTITVLTAMPNYPTGRVFDGYRWKLRKTETLDGMKVIRTWIYPSKSRNIFVRLFSYMSFVMSVLLLGLWKLGKHDIAIIESPPLFLGPSGLLAGRLSGAKTVFNVSDIWPDIVVRMGEVGNPMFVRVMEWLESYCYRHADCVALTNPGAVEQVRERFPKVDCTVISNGVDTTKFRPDLRSEDLRREFSAGPNDLLVGYCGLHGLAQGCEVILDAAKRLTDRSDIKFIMVGDGPTKNRLINEAKQAGLSNLTFYERRPKSDMPALVASLDVSMIPLSVRLPGTMPSKFYEALAAGTAVAVAKGCEAEPLVTRHGVGIAFEPLDGAELADGLRRLADTGQDRAAMSSAARKLADRFDRQKIAGRTEHILQAIVDGEPLPEVEW